MHEYAPDAGARLSSELSVLRRFDEKAFSNVAVHHPLAMSKNKRSELTALHPAT
jgi:hypothetical protein